MLPTAIVQARMSSRRLPNKALHPIAGRPMLSYLIERLRRCRRLAGVALATSTMPEDDAIAGFCADLDVPCYRGPLDDVLGRFLQVVQARALASVVRISGDSPLLDPALVDGAVELFEAGGYDLVTNVAPRSFPRGQSVEVVTADALRRLDAVDVAPDEREHVTLWFYRHPERCAMRNFAAARDMSAIKLAVDTPEDLAMIARIIAQMDRPHWQYGLEELLELQRTALALTGS